MNRVGRYKYNIKRYLRRLDGYFWYYPVKLSSSKYWWLIVIIIFMCELIYLQMTKPIF